MFIASSVVVKTFMLCEYLGSLTPGGKNTSGTLNFLHLVDKHDFYYLCLYLYFISFTCCFHFFLRNMTSDLIGEEEAEVSRNISTPERDKTLRV